MDRTSIADGPRIAVRPDVKARLDALKVHPREATDDVIRRVLDVYERTQEPRQG